MTMCMVNEQGVLVDIPQVDREPNEGEFKVPLQGYYEKLNEDRYDIAVWSFDLEKWIGQGEQRPIIPQQPSEIEILQAKLNSATQQLDFQEELIVELAMKVYE